MVSIAGHRISGGAKRGRMGARLGPMLARTRAGFVAGACIAALCAFATYSPTDRSLNAASSLPAHNLLGQVGADIADIAIQGSGLVAVVAVLTLLAFAGRQAFLGPGGRTPSAGVAKSCAVAVALVALALALASAPTPAVWPLASGLGGVAGDAVFSLLRLAMPDEPLAFARVGIGSAAMLAALIAGGFGLGLFDRITAPRALAAGPGATRPKRQTSKQRVDNAEIEPTQLPPADVDQDASNLSPLAIKPPKAPSKVSSREAREVQPTLPFMEPGFRLPELGMLSKPRPRTAAFDELSLRQNAQLLETVLSEFGVRGQIDQIRPGPVVTLYELVPAAGVKSARVVALSDDIARSMSVAACRVSVVPGRNAIGIELPNAKRETVYLRDLLSSAEYDKSSQALPLALGETIGGEPYIVDLAKMPHLLIAGTTGSGKSVGVNAMILSILYRLPPEKCRFIMIDPKMLELSVYDGIPHLLAPVVTDPKKAIVALKWTVREMEDRYRRMSKIGVRNVAGYNERASEAQAKGEHFIRTVQTGFDDQGRPIFEEEKLRPEPMPYLVVVIDEVADLMMVAGKDIEGAVQRLAQMARAAGIHLIMATQRPSVDVITGTIKANFPTRISFQVTSKIDSRTIMGEQGAEQLLGMGDMLYMAGGGRITRLHGPFVDDAEVDKVTAFLRQQGEPQYLDDVTAQADDDDGGDGPSDDAAGGSDLYDQAVAIVTRDRKASTSYVQRRLQIGYNRAASLIERMEREGVVTAANHAGKRDILVGPPP